jgi:hypothetical protein
MIPKIIHYCWFGGNPLPPLAVKCIESWKKYCPDYLIKCWDESNYDIKKNKYMLQAYQSKKWGFVPDYARLDIIYEHGGIYLDTDVELIRSLDTLLDNGAFAGFEDGIHVGLGLGFGAMKNSNILKEILNTYNDIEFINPDGTLNTTPSPQYQTEFMLKKGLVSNNRLQVIEGLTIYPSDVLCPKNFTTGKLKITHNTYSIHHFDGSWMGIGQKARHERHSKIYRTFGMSIGKKVARLSDAWGFLKNNGLKGVYERIKKKPRMSNNDS